MSQIEYLPRPHDTADADRLLFHFADALIGSVSDEALAELADRLTPLLLKRLDGQKPEADGWLDTKRAAEYLDTTVNALHKLTAARRIPFEQDCHGGKCYFKRSDLDAWRRGEQQRQDLPQTA